MKNKLEKEIKVIQRENARKLSEWMNPKQDPSTTERQRPVQGVVSREDEDFSELYENIVRLPR